MRTTVMLDDDVVQALQQLRREHGLATSAALNTLARRGMAASQGDTPRFTQRTSTLGRARIPLDDVGAALEVLEGETHRG